MFLDSFYILDQAGNIILSKNYSFENKDDIINEFYFEYNKRRENVEDYYPILDIKKNYCAYVAVSDVIFVSSFTNDMHILLIYSILHHILAIVKSAFDAQLLAERLKENVSSLITVIDHFMDYGYPLVNDNFVMYKVLKTPTMLQKVEKAIKSTGITKSAPVNVLEKYVDSMSDIREENWSVADIKTENEILFDVLEFLDTIMDKDGQIIHSEIHGEIKMDSKIPSPVDINVFMTIPQGLKDFSLHPCLYDTFDSFEKEKVLSFKAPQGNVQLLNYKADPTHVRVPFDVIPSVKFTGDELFIEIQVRACMIRGTPYKTDDFHMKIFMPSGITQKEIKVSKGSTRSNDKTMTILWKAGDFSNIDTAKLNLIYGLNGLTKDDIPNMVVCIKYQIQGYTYSGTKVDKAIFKDPDCKFVKKARCIAKSGYYEIRLN